MAGTGLACRWNSASPSQSSRREFQGPKRVDISLVAVTAVAQVVVRYSEMCNVMRAHVDTGDCLAGGEV